MGKYMTHEQLPFNGKLVKIRLRTYGFNSIVTQPRNEEELLEITPSGTVKLTTTRVDGEPDFEKNLAKKCDLWYNTL